MRRLAILRRFAKRLGLEFDIENMEISLLTKQKSNSDSNEKQAVQETDNELGNKQNNFEEIADAIQY